MIPASQFFLFTELGGFNAALSIGAIAMWDGPLAPAQIAALGGPGGPLPPDGQITTPVDQVTALSPDPAPPRRRR